MKAYEYNTTPWSCITCAYRLYKYLKFDDESNRIGKEWAHRRFTKALKNNSKIIIVAISNGTFRE